jgi:hypothetical protein
MKIQAKELSMMAIIAMTMLIAFQRAGAQENTDTFVQASITEPTAVVAIAPAADIQILPDAQQVNSAVPLTFPQPVQQAHKKAKNFEEVGNALGFVLPALTMAGLVLLAML